MSTWKMNWNCKIKLTLLSKRESDFHFKLMQSLSGNVIICKLCLLVSKDLIKLSDVIFIYSSTETEFKVSEQN